MAREMKPDDEERDEHGSPVTLAELKGIMPTVDWPQFLSVLGIPKVRTPACDSCTRILEYVYTYLRMHTHIRKQERHIYMYAYIQT